MLADNALGEDILGSTEVLQGLETSVTSLQLGSSLAPLYASHAIEEGEAAWDPSHVNMAACRMCALTRLTSLEVNIDRVEWNPKFQYYLPSAISYLVNLQRLSYSSVLNQGSRGAKLWLPEQMSRLVSLTYVHLSGVQLPVNWALRRIPHVRTLHLGGASVSFDHDASLSCLSFLQRLSVHNLVVYGTMQPLCNLPRLRELEFVDAQGAMPERWPAVCACTGLTSLRFLNEQPCRGPGLLRDIADLSDLVHLRQLELDRVNAAAGCMLPSLSLLERFSLSLCVLQDFTMRSELTCLTWLQLQECSLSSFSSCCLTQLRSLDLCANCLRSVPQGLEDLVLLTFLSLAWQRVLPAFQLHAPLPLQAWASMQVLNLHQHRGAHWSSESKQIIVQAEKWIRQQGTDLWLIY